MLCSLHPISTLYVFGKLILGHTVLTDRGYALLECASVQDSTSNGPLPARTEMCTGATFAKKHSDGSSSRAERKHV